MKKRTEKIIYQTYKKFYGKEPNLNKENMRNLTIEIQAMAYILNRYGVTIGENGFCYEYTDLNMPMSMSIQDVIIEKLIGNKENLNDSSFQFDRRAERIINIVASAIKIAISNRENQIEELRKIVNLLYVKEHVCPSANKERLMEVTKCSEKDLINIEQLEYIINEGNKNNFDKVNITNIDKMINTEKTSSYGMFVNENGNGQQPIITEESRRIVAKSLIK